VVEQDQIENPAAILQGRVESIAWEQLRIQRGSSGENMELPMHSRFAKYDVDGHVVEEIDRQNPETIAETRSTRTYSQGRLMSVKWQTFSKDGKRVGDEFWETYQYDPGGNLVDFRRGRGQSLQNHYVSKYDASDRLSERQVRQGEKDELLFTEQFVYAGNPPTVQLRILSPQAPPRDSTRYRLDEGGKIVELWDEEGYHVRWRYDGQHRVVEQSTDAYAVPSGCDECPLPGTVQVRYTNSSRQEDFLDPTGKTVLRRIVQLERDGSIAAITFERPTGTKEQDAPDLNRVVASILPQGGQSYVETTWDAHNNWIEKKRFYRPLNRPPVIQSLFRRKIVYR
jgi:hypothetical protein